MFCVVSSYAFASFWVAVRSIDRDTCPRSRTHDRRPELRSVVLGCGKYCQTKTGFIKKKMRSIRFFCLCGFRVAVSRPMVEGELKFSMTPRQRNGGVAHPDGSRCDDPDRVQRSVPPEAQSAGGVGWVCCAAGRGTCRSQRDRCHPPPRAEHLRLSNPCRIGARKPPRSDEAGRTNPRGFPDRTLGHPPFPVPVTTIPRH